MGCGWRWVRFCQSWHAEDGEMPHDTAILFHTYLVATLPVMTAFPVFPEMFRLCASVLRRDEADDAFGAAADFPGVTFAVPITTVLERFAVLITSALIQTGTIDTSKIAFPSVRKRKKERESERERVRESESE